MRGAEVRFGQLVAEAAAAPVEGWDFGWLDGRATEQRPSWGYTRLIGERMARAHTALDVQTGGGEILAGLPRLAPRTIVPGFTVDGFRERLEALHERLRSGEPFVATTTRFLIEARRPR